MDTLHHMRVVLAIAEKGSLTAAAAHIGTSVPTVVRILATVEQHLGVRLFERTTRKVHITEEGLLYVESCRRVLSEVAELEDALYDRKSEPAGRLVITAPLLFGQLHVSPVLNEFLARYLKVTARLTLTDRIVDLIEEGVDIAVRIGKVNDQSLVATRVGAVSQCVCATAEFLERHEPIETPADLENVPFVQHLGLMPSQTITFRALNGNEDVALSNIRLSTSHGETAISACLAGVGAGVFLSYQVQRFVSSGQLRIILRNFEPAPLPVNLVSSPARRLSMRLRAFIDYAKPKLETRLNESRPTVVFA